MSHIFVGPLCCTSCVAQLHAVTYMTQDLRCSSFQLIARAFHRLALYATISKKTGAGAKGGKGRRPLRIPPSGLLVAFWLLYTATDQYSCTLDSWQVARWLKKLKNSNENRRPSTSTLALTDTAILYNRRRSS